MHSRCRRLCGEDRKNCFITNRKQIACIADMVINKISGLSYILQILKEALTDENKPLIKKAESQIQSLVDWIRFLEISADLREAIEAYQEYPNDRRRELRFPVTDIIKEFIALEVEKDGFFERVELLNISNSGILFKAPFRFQLESSIRAKLVFLKNPLRERKLSLTVKHCRKEGNHCLTGTAVEKEHIHEIKIFEDIYEYVRDQTVG